MTKLKTILLASLIVMALIVTQQAKAQPTSDDLKHLRQEISDLGKKLEQVKKCNSAENVTLCKMNVMGWSDEEAIFALGLNNSKVNK